MRSGSPGRYAWYQSEPAAAISSIGMSEAAEVTIGMPAAFAARASARSPR